MKKMCPVVHFEMAASDRSRMSKFYSEVFGWDAMMLGEEMGNYTTVSTAETDANGMNKVPGTINGGFYMKTETNHHEPSVVISVDDVHAYAKMVEANGGKMLGEPQEIPGIGMWASFIDTEGNRASILQPAR